MSSKTSDDSDSQKHEDPADRNKDELPKNGELDLDLGSLSIDKPRDFVGNREEKQKLEDIAGEDGSNVNNEAPPKSEEKEDLESNQPTRTNNTGDIDDKPIIPVDEIQFSFSPIDNYTSVMRFEDMNLREELLLGIYDVGFQCPSKIQEKALPLLLSSNHSNFIGQSQSGTGKTATFAIAALNRVDENMNHTQVVCISPSRELARQTMEFITLISKHTKITLGLAVRDSIDRNVQAIQDQVVVGTPGTLAGLVARRQLDVSHLKVFVVDEADHVLGEQNMGSQTLRVRKYAPADCQIIFLSATYSRRLMDYAIKLAPRSHKISLRNEELSVEGITQLYMVCKNYAHKYDVISALYGLLTVGQSMIFCQRKVTAANVGARLTSDGHMCAVIHGDFAPTTRDLVIDDFRKGNVKVLICSNMVSRGLDIEQVNVVINFDIPLDVRDQPDPETYLHRIGRTGRFGRSGISINLVHDARSLENMKAIVEHFGRPVNKIEFDSLSALETRLRDVLDAQT